ncbi:MAG: DsbA family protein [Ruegeria sp.]
MSYFHDVSDPFSFLTSQVLREFCDRYSVELRPYLISGPPNLALPDPAAHQKNALADAARLACKQGLVVLRSTPPDRAAIASAEARLAAELRGPDFARIAREVSAALWAGQDIPSGPTLDPAEAKQSGDQQLADWGHYLGGTFHYAGEWYWSIDRLHYLETRLQELGLGDRRPPIAPPSEPRAEGAAKQGGEVEFFFSFRSPSSYLAFDRVRDLTRHHNAHLILRPVLPMLMRGLPVPPVKSSYILYDCAREARRMGIPFGRICDPLGRAVERGYALLDHAEAQGRLAEFCVAFMSGVWSQGIDAATDRGLARIAEAAGLNWDVAKAEIHTNDWRPRIEVNQAGLQEIGLWGVPSFHVAGQSIWGQDRLWAVEELLAAQG